MQGSRPSGGGAFKLAGRLEGEQRNEHDWQGQVRIKIAAVVGAHLAGFHLDRELNALSVDVVAGERVPRELLSISVVHSDPCVYFAPAPVAAGPRRVRIPVAERLPEGTVTVALNYGSEGAIHRFDREVPPVLRGNVRFAAAEAIDRRLLDAGLTDGKPGEFERSVAHLLAMAGFSVLWWGPNDNQKRTGIPLPEDAIDFLAFPGDDRYVLAVECTVDEAGDKKLRLIADRRGTVEQTIESRTGRAIPVFGVLAIRRPLDSIPRSLRQTAEVDHSGLISSDDLSELRSMVLSGEPSVRIRAFLSAVFERTGLNVDEPMFERGRLFLA